MNADNLIERLRAVKWEPIDDAERVPDDPTHKCVFVDMRPDDFAALLREVADALEAAREDAERYRWLRENPEHGFGGGALVQVFTGHEASEFLHSHALDTAIDQARGKGGGEVEGG